MAFDPNQHMMNLKGKQYLPVAARLAWLRETAPDAVAVTELIDRSDTFALFRAVVTLPTGGSATGWGSETRQDFGDFIEKAETKALGRALAALGFGTLHAAELDEGGAVADSPVDRRPTSASAGAPIPPLPAANLAPAPTNLATHGVQYEQAKGREGQTGGPAATSPMAALWKRACDVVIDHGITPANLEAAARDIYRMDPALVTRDQLTELVTAAKETRLKHDGRSWAIVKPPPDGPRDDADLPLGVVGEIAAAVK